MGTGSEEVAYESAAIVFLVPKSQIMAARLGSRINWEKFSVPPPVDLRADPAFAGEIALVVVNGEAPNIQQRVLWAILLWVQRLLVSVASKLWRRSNGTTGRPSSNL